MKKALLFANTDWYIFNFRRALAHGLVNANYEVIFVCPSGDYAERLKLEGFRIIPFQMTGRSMGVLSNLKVLLRIFRIYRAEKPQIVHHFTIKCVLGGGIAARLLSIPRINAITGLGHLFIHKSLKVRVLRTAVKLAYRFACGGQNVHSIFQNQDDQSLFIKEKMATFQLSSVIRGSGVDCNKFRPSSAVRPCGPCRVLFVGRLTREKGVFELLRAARSAKEEGAEFELILAGQVYPGNPSSLTEKQVEAVRLSEEATLLGHVSDMLSLLQRVDLVVLPSYSEGTPKSLLEAAACGLPIVATDIPGCRGLVIPGHNGELVNPRCVQSLKESLVKLSGDPDLCLRYGAESRKIASEHFSDEKVISHTLLVYSNLT